MLLKVLKPLTVDNISEASRKQLRRLFALSPQIKKTKTLKSKAAGHSSQFSQLYTPAWRTCSYKRNYRATQACTQ